MSRIGNIPIAIPNEVIIELSNDKILVKGPKGELSLFYNSSLINLRKKEKFLIVEQLDKKNKLSKALNGTMRSIIYSMVKGVINEFEKELYIKGVGFKAEIKENLLNLKLGFSHNIIYTIPYKDIAIKIQNKEGTMLLIKGINKYEVGQVAANIKSFFPAEPYKGKGIYIKGEFVRKKEGKKAS